MTCASAGRSASIRSAAPAQLDAILGRCGGRCRGGLREVGPLNLPRLVALEHVAFFDVVEPVEKDAALESLADLARIVLEPLELRDACLVDDVDANLGVLDLRQLADDGFHRPDDIALDDEVEVLDTAGLHLLEEAFE